MKIIVSDLATFSQPVVGNVYPVGGGYGRKVGHAMVLLAITKKSAALLLVIDKDGDPVGVTSYGLHAIEERAPIAFVPGLEELTFPSMTPTDTPSPDVGELEAREPVWLQNLRGLEAALERRRRILSDEGGGG